MAADLKACGWHDLFQVGSDTPTLPEELTSKWWEKKKQLLAKTKSTGIGELLTQLEKDGKALIWSQLTINPVEKQSVHERIEKDFIPSGSVSKFRKQLLAVQKSAAAWSKEFKKSSSTQKTGDALDDMAQAASDLADILDPKGLQKALDAANEGWSKAVGKKLAANLGLFVTQLHKRLETMDSAATGNGYLKGDIIPAYQVFDKNRTEPNRQVLAGAMNKYGRTLTTPLGQLIKIAESGITIDNFDLLLAKKLYQQLEVFGADANGRFIAGMDSTDVVVKVADLSKLGTLCKKAFGNLQVKL